MIGMAVGCGITAGAGLSGLLVASLSDRGGRGVEHRVQERRSAPGTGTIRSLLLPCLAGVLAGLVTGWLAVVPIAAAAVWGLPRLFTGTSGSVSLAKIEAIAAWTELLHGTLAASAGLSQAIIATAPLAPTPIRGSIVNLAARLSAGMDPTEALGLLGDDLADPCADRVICALLLAMSSRAQRLGDLLAALAESTRDEVGLRLRIETSRASVRSGVRTVIAFSVVFAALLALLARSYLAPFGSVTGQLVLLVVGLLYALGLALMVTMSRPPEAVRLLGSGELR